MLGIDKSVKEGIMRLWHQDLLKKLPKQWLQGQHRECCAMRGKGWGRKHSTVDYVWEHSMERLIAYHLIVINLLSLEHKVCVSAGWYNPFYRGKHLREDYTINYPLVFSYLDSVEFGFVIYPEHNDEYLQNCIENLKEKGVII